MASPSQMTVTVDRISNSGNAIARERLDGKTIHVPASTTVGDTLDVRITDRGGYFEARLVDRATELQPRQPGLNPDTSDLAKGRRKKRHDYSVGPSITGETTESELRNHVATRKL